jgi:hypothetical protein
MQYVNMYVRKQHDILRDTTRHSVLVLDGVRTFGTVCLCVSTLVMESQELNPPVKARPPTRSSLQPVALNTVLCCPQRHFKLHTVCQQFHLCNQKICINYMVRIQLYIFTHNSTLGVQLHVSALCIVHRQVVL